MKIYTVHLRRHGLDPQRDLVLVREGFSWMAFVLSLIWALWHRMWLVAIALAILSALLNVFTWGLGTDSTSASVMGLGVAVLTGLLANDIRRWHLTNKGFAELGVVAGDTEDDALTRFLADHPDLAKGLL